MATDTIRKVLVAIVTSVEGLTPTRGSDLYRFADSYRDDGDGNAIPSSIKNRAIGMKLEDAPVVQSISGNSIQRMLTVRLDLFHTWKKHTSHSEAEIVRSEDRLQIQEQFEFKKPGGPATGEAFGVQIWRMTDDALETGENYWRTSMTFEGRCKLLPIVTLAG